MTNGSNKLDDLLSAYHDGELSAAERQTVEQILQNSADARAELEDYQSISASLRSLPKERAPESFRNEVLDRIHSGAPAKQIVTSQNPVSARRRRRSFLAMVIGGVLTAACILLAVQGRFAADTERLHGVARTESSSRAPDFEAPRGELGRSMASNDASAENREAENELAEGQSTGGIAGGMGGFSAADASVGDVYSYFDQTGDGDIVVVEATVVDVRQAVDQLQVLFLNNSIPTTTVALDDEAELVQEPNSDLAIYVESDPSLINNALEQLRKELKRDDSRSEDTILDAEIRSTNSFVDLKIAGTITSPANTLDPVGEALIGRLEEGAREYSDQALSGRRSLWYVPGKYLKEPDAARARFSVPAEASTEETPASAATPFGARQGSPQPEPAAPIANYQTILNVSKSRLNEQLQAPKETVAGSEQKGAGSFFRNSAREQEQFELAPNSRGAAQLPKLSNTGSPGNPLQRRGRMLVVLESREENGSSDESAQPKLAAPVEAPSQP